MRIRLMTFHTPKNYGAVLQAYALQSYLKGICDDVKIIDYDTPELRKKYPLLSKITSLKGAVLSVISLLYLPPKISKYKSFSNFVNRYLDLTSRYNSTYELYKNPPECELLITGSDQVFNPNRSLTERQAFYLDFAPKRTKIASYAASFGVNSMPEDKQEEIAEYLNKFDYISTREFSGIRIIESISEKSAIEVLDPVFLLNSKEWYSVSEEYRGLPEKFLLYYRLLDSPNGDRVVEKIAQRLGMEIIVLTDSLRSKVKTKYVPRDVGPDEFIWLYRKSAFVVTNAFHGTAFSIVFNKQFIFCDENPRTQERSANLLNKLNLKSRMLPGDIEELLSEKIDYELVNTKLQDYIDKSKDYLKTVLHECYGERND